MSSPLRGESLNYGINISSDKQASRLHRSDIVGCGGDVHAFILRPDELNWT